MKPTAQTELFNDSALRKQEIASRLGNLRRSIELLEFCADKSTEDQAVISACDAVMSTASRLRLCFAPATKPCMPKAVESQPKPAASPLQSLQIYFDGGCSPNPGNKYGSYEVFLDGRSIQKAERISFGWGTNNEAEFEALTAALKFLANYANETELRLDVCGLKIFTDSTIVRNRVGGKNKIHNKLAWRESSTRMFELASRVLEFKPLFCSFTIEWLGRDNNVERFGH
ncbi:MAG: hypothetical protein KGL39_33685 [Patescibacteria group bacterium]|nr:hypothetical protein [Patescibacteria group bacterium]